MVSVPGHMDFSTGLLECPSDVTSDVPQNEFSKRGQGRSLKVFSDLASEITRILPEYPRSYRGQLYSPWRGSHKGMTTRRGRSLQGCGWGHILKPGYPNYTHKEFQKLLSAIQMRGSLIFCLFSSPGNILTIFMFSLTWLLIVSALDLWRALSLRKSKSPVGQNRKKGLKNLLSISLPVNHPFCKWCQNIVYNHWSPLPSCSPDHRCPRVSPEIKNGVCNRFS